MSKKGITVVIEEQELEKLKQLSGFASAFVSTVISEFFQRITVDDVWKAMEMEKPGLDKKKRIDRLKVLIKNVFDQNCQKKVDNNKIISPEKVKDYWSVVTEEVLQSTTHD